MSSLIEGIDIKRGQLKELEAILEMIGQRISAITLETDKDAEDHSRYAAQEHQAGA